MVKNSLYIFYNCTSRTRTWFLLCTVKVRKKALLPSSRLKCVQNLSKLHIKITQYRAVVNYNYDFGERITH